MANNVISLSNNRVINNVAYSWSMLEFSFTQNDVELVDTSLLKGVTSIKWSKERKVDTLYGVGGEPIGRGFGNITYKASITLNYSAIDALRSLAGDSLMNLGEFDLKISYKKFQGQEGESDLKIITMLGCLLNEDGFDAKQDETNIEKEIQLNPIKIIVGEQQKEAYYLL